MAGLTVGIPRELVQRGRRVIRPRDLADRYTNPRAEVARMARNGVLHRIATGYYAVPPLNRLGDPRWVPDIHAAALGLGQADYGPDAVALMGIGAAQLHGAVPRRLATTVLAVPKQRPAVRIDDARLVFVKRDVPNIDVERAETELGPGWVTTVEQTALDLAGRPGLGGIEVADAEEAIRALVLRAERPLLEELAAAQHRPGALATIDALVNRA